MLLTDTLIAVTVSLGLSAGALTAWSSLRASQQSLQALDQLHSQHRQLQALFSRLSRSAGATSLSLDARGAARWTGKSVAIDGTDGGGTRDDTVTWHHPRALDPHDCQGNQISTLDVLSNQFKISSKQELSCKDIGRAGTLFQALAERVEDLQALYAEAQVDGEPNPSQAPLQWKSADQIRDWRQVRAVELCLRWASPGRLMQGSASWRGCQDDTVSRDGRLRRLGRQVYWLGSQQG